MLYVEWCSKPAKRSGVMLPESKLEQLEKAGDAGFRSVYMFDEDSANAIQKSRSSKGLGRYPLYSKTLFIDLDDGESSLGAMIDWVHRLSAEALIYSSGGKGFHFHITISPMEGRDTPWSQRVFAEQSNLPIDRSLYRPGSLIALPGRVHPKTGIKKKLVKQISGSPITIPIVESPTIDFSEFRDETNTLQNMLTRAQYLILFPPPLGNRFNSMWSFAKNCADCGLHAESAYNLLYLINENWQNKKELSELQRAIEQAYK